MTYLEQISQALLNADAAGDTEAATVLAQEYRKLSEAQAQAQAPQATTDAGYLSQLGSALSIGARQMASGVKATFNAATGDIPDTAAAMAQMGALQKEQQANLSAEEIALNEAFARNKAEYDQARGILPTIGALSGYVGSIASQPGAAFKQAIQSAPNAAISAGTGLAGYALGGLLGAGAGIETGPGAVLTSIAGAVAGGAISNSLMEASPAIYDILNERTNGAASSMTADQITQVLQQNPDIMSEGLKTGAIRGSVIGVIEGLGMKGAGRLMSIPERAAARAVQKTLIGAGVDVASKEAVESALLDPALKNAVSAAAKTAQNEFTSAGNLARLAGASGIEIGASGAGEVGAQVATGQEIDPTAAVQEMMGEVGLSIPVAAVAKGLELARTPQALQTPIQQALAREINAIPTNAVLPQTEDEKRAGAEAGNPILVDPQGNTAAVAPEMWNEAIKRQITPPVEAQAATQPSDVEARLANLMRNPGLTAAANTADSIVTTAENTSSDVSQATTAARNIIQGVVDTPQPQVAPAIELPATTPSPAMEQLENLSQTITDSNGEIAPEMSVLPPTVQAGAGAGEAIQPQPIETAPDAIIQREIPENRVEERLQIDEGGPTTAPSSGNRFIEGGQIQEEVAPPITPQGTPTPATEGKVMPGGSAIERDTTKPEQMTPEERFNRPLIGVVRPKSLPLGASKKSNPPQLLRQFDKGVAWAERNDSEKVELFSFQKRNDLLKTRQRNGYFGTDKAAEDYAFWKGASAFFEAKQVSLERQSEMSLPDAQKAAQHSDDILIAFDSNEPVSSAAVDAYGIKLPEGYVKQGELYVFQPTNEAPPIQDTPSGSVQAAEPAASTTKDSGEATPQTTTVAAPTETAAPSAKEAAVASVVQQPVEGSIPTVEQESATTAIESTEKADVADAAIQEVVDESTDLNPITDEMVDSSLSPVEKREAAIILGKRTWNDSKELFKQRMSDWMAGANETSKKLIKFFKSVASKARLLLAASIGLSMANSTSDANLAESNQFKAFRIPVSSVLNSKPARPKFGGLPDMNIGIPEQKIPLGAGGINLSARRKIDAKGKSIPADVVKTAQWALDTKDTEGYPFIVTDKVGAAMYFFDENGVLLKKSPVLVGKNVGDFIGNTDAGRITPSGRFEIAPETDATYGNVFSVMGTDMVDSETGDLVEVAIHRLALHDPSENRPQRIATKTPLDNRISWGCLNLDNKVMDWAVRNYPLGGVIYILPETAKGRSAFAPFSESNIESSKLLTKSSNVDRLNELNNKEDKKLQAAQKQREELGLKTLNSLIEKTRTNVVQGTVKSSDANQAVAILNKSGAIPNVLFTWIGTSKDFLADPANRARYPETWKAVSSNPNIEGMSENGQPIVFTDNVGVSDLDRNLAKLQGTTPEVAAVRRVILHENIHKGMFFLSLKDKMKLFQFLHRLYSPEELDQLAKSYDEYSDWRINQVSYFSIIEEAMTRDFDSMAEIPRDGIWAEFMQFLRDIWQKITGKTSEPTLKNYKDVFRLIRNSLKNSEKANADRLKNGGEVRMSLSGRDSLRVKMTRKAMTEAALNQAEWKDWYEEHQETLDEFFGDHAQQFQDILSVTSQAASVKANVGLALKAFGQWHRGEDFVGFLPAVVQNLNRLRDKTQIQGQKISAYKKNNDGTVDEAVIDRHIARLVFGVDSPSKAQFEKAQQILSEVANNIGWTPRQVQAALWAHSIYKSGKTPESYGNYLKKLESKGTLIERIGSLSLGGSGGDGASGGRGRFAPSASREGSLANIRFSKVIYDSPNEAAFNSGAEVARNSDYDERDKAVRSTIRAAYDLAPKNNGPSVPLDQLFDIAKQSMPDLTENEFSQILQDLYEDSGALLQAGESPFIVTTPDGQRAGSAIIVSSLPTGAMASAIDPEDDATKKFVKDIQSIESGTLKAAFEGRQFKDFMPIDRTIKPNKSYEQAAIDYVNSFLAEGGTLEQMANSVIAPNFLAGIGIEDDVMARQALVAEVRNRIVNAGRKKKSKVEKKFFERLNQRISAFWQGVGTKGGRNQGQRAYIIGNPRYSWMFLTDEVDKELKQRRDNILNVQFGNDNATSFTQNSYENADMASTISADEVAKDVSDAIGTDTEDSLLREGEFVLGKNEMSLWQEAKDIVMELAYYARAKARDTKSSSKASLTDEQSKRFAAILTMPKAEREIAESKARARLAVVLNAFLGKEPLNEVPMEKAKRNKREKMVEVVKKRLEQGKPIDFSKQIDSLFTTENPQRDEIIDDVANSLLQVAKNRGIKPSQKTALADLVASIKSLLKANIKGEDLKADEAPLGQLLARTYLDNLNATEAKLFAQSWNRGRDKVRKMLAETGLEGAALEAELSAIMPATPTIAYNPSAVRKAITRALREATLDANDLLANPQETKAEILKVWDKAAVDAGLSPENWQEGRKLAEKSIDEFIIERKAAKERSKQIAIAVVEQSKNPASLADFSNSLAQFKIKPDKVRELFDQAKLLAKRRVQIANDKAIRVLFEAENKLAQSAFFNSSTKPDTIVKAFREQISDPMDRKAFKDRLMAMEVTLEMADKLFDKAAREKDNAQWKRAQDMLEGPNALRNIIREINRARPGDQAPLSKQIPWRKLLSQKAKTVEEYRQRIFDAISANEELKSATPEQKARLADLFTEAWESNRKRILDGMQERLIREKEAKGDLSKKGAEALQEQRMRIVEDINLGIFDNDEIAKIMAEKFGIKSEFTDAEREKIESLIEILQDEKLNRVKRNKAAYELLETLSAQTDIPIAKLLANFWVSSVLSGMNTVFSIGMSVFSGMGELTTTLYRIFVSAFSNPKQLPSEVAAAFKTLARVLSAAPRQANRAWQYLVTGDQAFLDPTMNDALKNMDYASIGKNNQLAEQMAKSDKILQKVMGLFMRTVSRLLNALDLFNSGLTKEGSLSIVFRQLNLDPAKIEMLEKKSDLKAYKAQVIRDDFNGIAPKTLYEKALIDSYALAEMMKALDELGNVSENADQMAMQGAMTLDPSGIGGYGYRLVKSMMKSAESGADKLVERNLRKWDEAKNTGETTEAGVKLALSYIFQFAAYNAANLVGVRFARFAGNKFNQSLSFLPGLGALRLFEAEFDADRIRGKEAFTDMIKRNQLTGVMAAAIGYVVLKAIAEEPDDEKRGAFINGGWSNLTPEKKQQKLASGQKEYTLGFGDTVINYGNWPGSGIIAAIGGLSDLIRFSPEQWSEKTVLDKLMSATASGVFSALEVPALSQFQELFGSSLSSKDPNEQKLTKFARVIGNYAGGFVPRFLKDIDYSQDPNLRKYETLWEKIASHIPVYRRYEGKEYYDILGQQIQRNVYPGSREFMTKPTDPAYKVLGALISRGIWLTPANAEHRMVGKGARRRSLTQEEADNYSLETGKGYKQMLMRYGQRALQMPTERAKAFLLDKADDVRDRALKKVYRGYTPAS